MASDSVASENYIIVFGGYWERNNAWILSLLEAQPRMVETLGSDL